MTSEHRIDQLEAAVEGYRLATLDLIRSVKEILAEHEKMKWAFEESLAILSSLPDPEDQWLGETIYELSFILKQALGKE